jgi:hypothetical protein
MLKWPSSNEIVHQLWRGISYFWMIVNSRIYSSEMRKTFGRGIAAVETLRLPQTTPQ